MRRNPLYLNKLVAWSSSLTSGVLLAGNAHASITLTGFNASDTNERGFTLSKPMISSGGELYAGHRSHSSHRSHRSHSSHYSGSGGGYYVPTYRAPAYTAPAAISPKSSSAPAPAAVPASSPTPAPAAVSAPSSSSEGSNSKSGLPSLFPYAAGMAVGAGATNAAAADKPGPAETEVQKILNPKGKTKPTGASSPEIMVMRVQVELKSRNYYDGEIDGKMSLAFRNSLKSFQVDHKLDPTGKMDDKTLQQLGLFY